MTIEISEVLTNKQLKEFVKFPLELFKNNQYYVPQLLRDEIETFKPTKNPAFEVCEVKLFLAHYNKDIVGRIAAILNKPANKKYNTKHIRFGWFDTINDFDIASALFQKAEDWGRNLGMKEITGPHGFCDLDPQGLLIEGFDKLPTIASYYHYPYYQKLLEQYGFEKEIDFVEYSSTPPYDTGIPDNLLKMNDWIKKRYNYRIAEYDSIREYKKHAKELFSLLEDTFIENYGTVPLTEKQVHYYINKYISFINKELVKFVFNENNEMVGFLVSMPSLSKAFQKAKGRLFPFGIFHILKGLKTYETIDFLFAGVKKEYRGKGVDTVMVLEIVKSAMKLGFKYAESNQELENNTKVQREWKFFNPVLHKRRRIYIKKL
ncbi:MAG: hypothetical protein EPN82_01665 [Bacteroidetes bacterium]|nr:MAG: hypothetical protein EPN82_01665 [Bacteroidota bacterium]